MDNKKVETVEADCRHPDCCYRRYINGGVGQMCAYMLVEGKCRGCSISECDKYRSGKKKQPRLKSTFQIYWEYEYYDEGTTDNPVQQADRSDEQERIEKGVQSPEGITENGSS